MTIETIHTGYGDPEAPEGSVPRRIADIEKKDAALAEVGLELSEDERRQLGRLVAWAETVNELMSQDNKPAHVVVAPDEPHPFIPRESERAYVPREPILDDDVVATYSTDWPQAA